MITDRAKGRCKQRTSATGGTVDRAQHVHNAEQRESSLHCRSLVGLKGSDVTPGHLATAFDPG